MKQKDKILVYIRGMERRDIPQVSRWISSKDYRENYLADYPLDNLRILRNQLLKEISMPKFIAASTRLLVAEVNQKLLTGFISLKNIDWQHRHLTLKMYIPPEYLQTDIPKIITDQVYRFVFSELNMHKLYEITKTSIPNREPEATLTDYLMLEKNALDIFIYSVYRKEAV